MTMKPMINDQTPKWLCSSPFISGIISSTTAQIMHPAAKASAQGIIAHTAYGQNILIKCFHSCEYISLYSLYIFLQEEQAWHEEHLPEHLPEQLPLKLLPFFFRKKCKKITNPTKAIAPTIINGSNHAMLISFLMLVLRLFCYGY